MTDDLLAHLPSQAELIAQEGDRLLVPPFPAVGYLEGDGIGPDLWRATRLVMDAAVAKAYGAERRLHWVELPAGEKAFARSGEHLPAATLAAIAGLRARAALPVAVGFGVAGPKQARALAGVADGVIVGTALMRALAEAPSPREGLAAAVGLAGEIAAAISRPPRASCPRGHSAGRE